MNSAIHYTNLRIRLLDILKRNTIRFFVMKRDKKIVTPTFQCDFT